MNANADQSNPTPLAYRIEGAAALLGVGRTTMYGLIADGEIPSFKVRGRRLVSHAAIAAYAARMEAAAMAADQPAA